MIVIAENFSRRGVYERSVPMQDYSKWFAKRLRDTLGDLTQADLIKLMSENGYEMLPGRLSHYMTGRNYPDPDVLAELAKALGVSADYLVGITDEPSPVPDLLEKLASASGQSKLDKLAATLNKEQKQQVIAFTEYLSAQNAPPVSPAQMRVNIVTMLESIERNVNATARKDFERGLRELGFHWDNG